VGSDLIQESSRRGEDDERLKDKLMDVLRHTFRPEFLNRVDEVVTFRALAQEDMVAVAKIQLARVEALLAEKRIGLDSPPDALDWLAREGFDPQLGARPLKRLIQQVVVNPLSRQILEGQLRPGQMATLAVQDDQLVVGSGAVQ
jgi:ATP-dependent Clp protease ATP-binding subunit ClpB